MGLVYKAHDRELDDFVAIKVLRSEVELPPDVLKRFRSEIKLARKVRHANVCAIHEYARAGHVTYLVMEYIDGVDLKQVLRSGPLPVADAFDVCIQAARGLNAIHSVGIIHRDLKAANIMRDRQGLVRVMDFGVAKLMAPDASSAGTATGHIVGTPEYMSPEQARAGPLDLRSDIYALGIVLFESFTGEVPFRGDTPVATLFKHLNEPPPLDRGRALQLPPTLVTVVGKALAKDREQRFQSALELERALQDARDDWAREVSTRATLTGPIQADPSRVTSVTPEAAAPSPTVLMTLPASATLAPSVPARSLTVAPPRMGPGSRRGSRRAAALVAVGVALTAALMVLVSGMDRGNMQSPRATPSAGTTLMSPPAVEGSPAPPLPSSWPSPAAASPSGPGSTSANSPSSGSVSERTVRAAATKPIVPTRTPAVVVPEKKSGGLPGGAAPVSPLPVAAPPAPPSGTLQIGVRPYGEVAIDGQSVGVTPLRPLKLAPGVHTVVINHPDYQPLRRRITIRSGEKARLIVDLDLDAIRK